jgi:hypothetical protein
MNKSLTLLSTALLLATASPVFAASSVDLTVKGLITPSACTLELPSGVVDFGKISAKDLNQDKQTRLEDKTLQLTVNCEAKTLFAINPIDNRVGSPSQTHPAAYGLGLINDTEKLGMYVFGLRNSVTEPPSTEILQFSGGKWRSFWIDDYATPNQLLAFGGLNESGFFPEPIENVSVEIWFNTWIARADTLNLTNEVALDGSATLELKYL